MCLPGYSAACFSNQGCCIHGWRRFTIIGVVCRPDLHEGHYDTTTVFLKAPGSSYLLMNRSGHIPVLGHSGLGDAPGCSSFKALFSLVLHHCLISHISNLVSRALRRRSLSFFIHQTATNMLLVMQSLRCFFAAMFLRLFIPIFFPIRPVPPKNEQNL